MTDLLDTFGDLTHHRNKDDLDTTLAEAVFALAGATSLSVWRLFHEGSAIRLRERLTLPVLHEHGQTRPLDTRREWRECYATRRYVCGPAAEGSVRHVFPISNDREMTGMLEITRPVRLEAMQRHHVDALLRVYCNHLNVLDYGDRDELTGLLNRRSFNMFFKHATQTPGLDAAIAVIDIDFFKRVNDQFGHPYGDEVLILMARLIVQCFAGVEGLFRFGGEEFLVILPETSPHDAWLAMEGFRATVEKTDFPQVGRVTISAGLSMIVGGDTGASAFGRADEALYVAKHSGRNRVKCYEELVADGTLAGAKQSGGEMELF
jgi:diguanylate cyclase (GGDEF)-like protein